MGAHRRVRIDLGILLDADLRTTDHFRSSLSTFRLAVQALVKARHVTKGNKRTDPYLPTAKGLAAILGNSSNRNCGNCGKRQLPQRQHHPLSLGGAAAGTVRSSGVEPKAAPAPRGPSDLGGAGREPGEDDEEEGEWTR